MKNRFRPVCDFADWSSTFLNCGLDFSLCFPCNTAALSLTEANTTFTAMRPGPLARNVEIWSQAQSTSNNSLNFSQNPHLYQMVNNSDNRHIRMKHDGRIYISISVISFPVSPSDPHNLSILLSSCVRVCLPQVIKYMQIVCLCGQRLGISDGGN